MFRVMLRFSGVAVVALLAGCLSSSESDADNQVMQVIAEQPAAHTVPGEGCPLLPVDFDLRELIERHVDGEFGSLQGPMRHSSHTSDQRSGVTQCVFLQEIADGTASGSQWSVALLVVAAHSNMDHLTLVADEGGPMTVVGQDPDGNLVQLLQQPVPTTGGLLYQEPLGDDSVITAFVDSQLGGGTLGQELLTAVQTHVLSLAE